MPGRMEPWSPAGQWRVWIWALCAPGCGGHRQPGASLCGHSPESGAGARERLERPSLKKVLWGARLLAALLTGFIASLPLTRWEALEASEGTPCSGPWARPGPDGSVAALLIHSRFSCEMPQSPCGPKQPFQEKLNPVQAHSPPTPTLCSLVSWRQSLRTAWAHPPSPQTCLELAAQPPLLPGGFSPGCVL